MVIFKNLNLNKNMKKKFLIILLIFNILLGFAQQLTWTGNAGNNDFFDEANWKDSVSNLPPSLNTINPNQAINLDLFIIATSNIITANGIINLGTGSLLITSANIVADAVSGGSIEINNEAYLNLNSNTPFQNNVTVNFNSGIAWVRTKNLKGLEIQNNHLNQITVNNQAAVYQSNLRLDNYYLNGTVIRNNALSTSPLTIFDNINLQGSLTTLSIDIIHSGVSIPDAMNNKAESFILKKGFMATFAVTDDGTGKSKSYIASEEDLIINELPSYLKNDISFIRVVSWNWVTKKGTGGNTAGLNKTWYYNWGNSSESDLELEFAPMSWGGGGANEDSDIELYKSKYNATHVMAFNEADNCFDQSGQYNQDGPDTKLCQTDIAVGLYKNLMKTGLRLVSPSCRENAPFGWLKEFHDKANAQDIRIDVIGVHWYDWGSSPANSPNANPTNVFNRFKNYLQQVYDLYKLPIWITEFNANPNRTTSVNYEFMKLALPYLESLDYVERYAWYQPNSDVADYYDVTGTTLTNVGTFYKNQISTASIPETIVTEDSNLDIYYTTTLDFEVFDLNTYGIYPNPSSGIFTLKGNIPISSYAIYNIHGKLIENASNLMLIEVNINLKNKTKGIYFITIKDRDGNQSSKKLILS